MNDTQVDKRIGDFIAAHHVMTLATVKESKPWCANLFYAFDRQGMRLIFSSAQDTRHIEEGLDVPEVACSIVVESRFIGRLRGAQIEGRLSEVSGEDGERCRAMYLRRFPYAALRLERVWTIDIRTVKYTDNRLGFGRKLFYVVGLPTGDGF